MSFPLNALFDTENRKNPTIMIDRYIKGIAGSFVLISLLLAHFVNPNWLWFTAFVGANLLQYAFTNWCLMEQILKKAGVK